MTSMKIVKFSRPLTPSVYLRPKFFHPLDLGRPILKNLWLPTFSNKLWNNNRTVHVNERNQNKNKIWSRYIQIDHVFYCSIQPTNNVMVSLKDGFIVWHQSQWEDFLLIKY